MYMYIQYMYLCHVHVHVCTVHAADVTRVLLLDENQAQGVSQSVTELLRDLSQAQAAKTFPVRATAATSPYLAVFVYFLMRDEKEGRKKQARSNKQGKATQQTQVHVLRVYMYMM